MEDVIAINWSLTAEWLNFGGLALGALFAGAMIVHTLICCVLAILCIIAWWIMLKKAKLPGRGILIPIYNVYLLFKLAGRPGGWTRRILFPPVLAVLNIIAQFDIAKRFWKDIVRGFGLWILPVIFYPILAFGKAKYTPKK